jgi:hypothetical protein
MRAQTTLPVLGIALLLLTAVAVTTVFAGQRAVEGERGGAIERATAVGLTERLVEKSPPLTVAPNVLNRTALDRLDAAAVRDRFGVPEDLGLRLRLDGETVARQGRVAGGYTIERIVLVEERQRRVRRPRVRSGRAVALPRRVGRIRLSIQPPPGTTVRAVLADGQVVLANESGLSGSHGVDVSRFRTTALRFDAVGPLRQGDVTLTYGAPRTRKARLVVTVDA